MATGTVFLVVPHTSCRQGMCVQQRLQLPFSPKCQQLAVQQMCLLVVGASPPRIRWEAVEPPYVLGQISEKPSCVPAMLAATGLTSQVKATQAR